MVSIIIPTYNRADLISETLDSILAQTYTNWECIIVDDGSTDNTSKVVKNYIKKDKRFQYHHRPSTRIKGPNACRNYGFELSKGEYVNWFDSDDLYFSNALETYLNSFQENTDVVIAKIEKIHSETKNRIKENNILSKNLIEDYFVGLITFYVCGPMWKRSFLNKQPVLFDEQIMNLDDWDYNLRMLYQKPNIVYINFPLIKYRIHENSLSHEIGKLNFKEIKSEMRARENHFKLIRKNKIVDPLILEQFVINRYKYFFREAMLKKNKYRYYYLQKLLEKEVKFLNFKELFKTFFGFIMFQLFNKGYKLLK